MTARTPGKHKSKDASRSKARQTAPGTRRKAKEAAPAVELRELSPAESARSIGLRYTTDEKPGVRRVAAGKHFRYVGPDGKPIRDEADVARIKHLAIPPAWTEVWICPLANGHLQATGRDGKGRKQYRYHERWREVRDETKYERMIAFGKALPRIRERVSADMGRPGLPKEKVLATVVRLLETTLIRVGNREYAVKNKSFGLTTMHEDHVVVDHGHVRFRFRGKSGVDHDVDVRDARLARIVARCQHIEGQELFQHVDESGAHHPIGSQDVNEYIRDVAGEEFTAKDFRTWAGTVLASVALDALSGFDTKVEAKKNVVEAVRSVSEKLGNTPSVCRKCYIHPAVLESYLDGLTIETVRQRAEASLVRELADLDPEEAAVMMLLHEKAVSATKTASAA